MMITRKVAMKNIAISLTVIAIICAGLIFTALNQPNKTKANPMDISLNQINTNLADGAIIVDVRTAKEFDINHADKAINIPIEDIKKGKLPTADKNKIIYVYCRSGKRAAEVKTLLASIGYTKVINLTSLKNWISLGGKSVNSTGKKCTTTNETSC